MPKILLGSRDELLIARHIVRVEARGRSYPAGMRRRVWGLLRGQRCHAVGWWEWRSLEVGLHWRTLEHLRPVVVLEQRDRMYISAGLLDGCPARVRPGSWSRLKTGELEEMEYREWRLAWDAFPLLLRFLLDLSAAVPAGTNGGGRARCRPTEPDPD